MPIISYFFKIFHGKSYNRKVVEIKRIFIQTPILSKRINQTSYDDEGDFQLDLLLIYGI